jgi:hypothetical protein
MHGLRRPAGFAAVLRGPHDLPGDAKLLAGHLRQTATATRISASSALNDQHTDVKIVFGPLGYVDIYVVHPHYCTTASYLRRATAPLCIATKGDVMKNAKTQSVLRSTAIPPPPRTKFAASPCVSLPHPHQHFTPAKCPVQ